MYRYNESRQDFCTCFGGKKGTFFKIFKIQKRDLFSPKRPFLSKKGTLGTFQKRYLFIPKRPLSERRFSNGVFIRRFLRFFFREGTFLQNETPKKKVSFW